MFFFFFKQKTAYEMRISDWSSDVCSSDLFEAVDEGTIAQILVAEGTDNVKVGTVIAVIAGEDEDASEAKAAPAPAPAAAAPAPTPQPARAEPVEAPSSPPTETKNESPSTTPRNTEHGNRRKASHLAHHRPAHNT